MKLGKDRRGIKWTVLGGMGICCVRGAIVVLALGTRERRGGGGNPARHLRPPTFPSCHEVKGVMSQKGKGSQIRPDGREAAPELQSSKKSLSMGPGKM